MKKAIIFDYDGVIVDSFINVFAVYKKICEHFKVACPRTLDEFRIIYGHNYINCLHNLGIAEKDFAEESQIYQTEIVKTEHEIFPGIFKVIEQLSKKFKLFIVSSSHKEEVVPKIKSLGLASFFADIYCGTEESERKAPMFKDLLTKNNYQPAEVIAIGDRAVDYEVAKEAGLADEDIILVTYGWGLDQSHIGQANIADNPEEILKFIP